MQAWKESNIEKYGSENDIPLLLKFTPSLINVILIIIYGAIYKVVAKMLVVRENHRYKPEHENSLINKMYLFEFINSYISNYIIAYWVRDFGQLATNLVIIMVFKQIGLNLFEYA